MNTKSNRYDVIVIGSDFGGSVAALRAVERLYAFFLEYGFLALLLFGWNKIGPKMHLFSTGIRSWISWVSSLAAVVTMAADVPIFRSCDLEFAAKR